MKFPPLMTREELRELQEECPHDSMDDFYCPDCHKDCSEDILSAAYDRAKDIWKYGE